MWSHRRLKISDVNGCVGGYSVLADGSDKNNQNLGKAGGFIGEMSGTIIKKLVMRIYLPM